MKILMLCYEYPPIGGGGAKVVAGLTSELIRQGHEVDLVTMGFKNLQRFKKSKNLNIYYVRCFRLKADICTPFEMLTYLIMALPLILKLCRQNNYDINHTHFIYPDGILAYIIKIITGLPYVVTAHGSDVPGYNPDRFVTMHKFLKPLGKRITANSQRVIVPSVNLENLIKKISPKVESTIIPNGINLNKFTPNGKREKKILVVTRMFERKGVQYFLQALTDFKHFYNINIVGDGPYLETLKRIAIDKKLNVNFLGFIDNNSKELRELYESSMIFVFTSEAENFPIVLLEAMVAGLAIITTNDTGCAEVVGDSAILVNSKNSEAIKDALEKLVNDPDLCINLGKAARKRAEEYFGWESISVKSVHLYSQFRKPSLLQEAIDL